MPGGVECVYFQLQHTLIGVFRRSAEVHRPDPGGAEGGWGHVSDSGSRGRPGGERQDAAAAQSFTSQHQQQERVSSADRYHAHKLTQSLIYHNIFLNRVISTQMYCYKGLYHSIYHFSVFFSTSYCLFVYYHYILYAFSCFLHLWVDAKLHFVLSVLFAMTIKINLIQMLMLIQ